MYMYEYIYIYASTTTTTTTPPLQPQQPPSTYNNQQQQQMATALPRISKYYDCGKLHFLTVNSPDQPSLA